MLKIETVGGLCPVQGFGTFDGKSFYFRARGDTWQFILANEDEDPIDYYVGLAETLFTCSGKYGPKGGFQAGYMSEKHARALIRKCVQLYQAGLPTEEEQRVYGTVVTGA